VSFVGKIKSSFFLKRHFPAEKTVQLLEFIYPSIPWNRIEFYEGLPWFTYFFAPYVTAQALPHFYSFGKFKIYLIKFDEERAQCLADIVHEGFHVLQAVNRWNGYGVGFFRGFTLEYTSFFLKHGYRQNPLEIPAYDQEYRFLSACAKHNIHGLIPQMSKEDYLALLNEQGLVFKKYDAKHTVNFALAIPAFFITLLITIAKPIADVLLYLFFVIVPWRTN
jgi:hypothetical protein